MKRFPVKILIYFFLLAFLLLLNTLNAQNNYEEQISLKEKIYKKYVDIGIKAGQGYYFYKQKSYGYSVPVNVYGIYGGVRYKETMLYQGLSINYINISQTEEKALTSDKTNIFSELAGNVIQTVYLVSFRKYHIHKSENTGWSYKKIYFGAGPAYYKYNFFEKINGNTKYYLCHRIGISAAGGVDFFPGKSSFAIGLHGEVNDIFSPPRVNEKIKDINIWAPFPLHQQIFLFTLKISFNF